MQQLKNLIKDVLPGVKKNSVRRKAEMNKMLVKLKFKGRRDMAATVMAARYLGMDMKEFTNYSVMRMVENVAKQVADSKIQQQSDTEQSAANQGAMAENVPNSGEQENGGNYTGTVDSKGTVGQGLDSQAADSDALPE